MILLILCLNVPLSFFDSLDGKYLSTVNGAYWDKEMQHPIYCVHCTPSKHGGYLISHIPGADSPYPLVG